VSRPKGKPIRRSKGVERSANDCAEAAKEIHTGHSTEEDTSTRVLR
jgi:hypothetical protein